MPNRVEVGVPYSQPQEHRADGETDDGDEQLATTSVQERISSDMCVILHARPAREPSDVELEAVVCELEGVGRRKLARAVRDEQPLGVGGLERRDSFVEGEVPPRLTVEIAP